MVIVPRRSYGATFAPSHRYAQAFCRRTPHAPVRPHFARLRLVWRRLSERSAR